MCKIALFETIYMYKKADFATSKTPAPKADRIKGSKKNPAGSAKSSSSASKISLSKSTISVLRKKLEDFRKKYPKKKNVSENDLKAVYRRGSGAYSSTHRPTISGGKPNSRAAWSYARVNAFLRKAAGLEVKKAYIQDDDLLKRGGQINPDEFALVVYHEKSGNWMVQQNKVYVWLYEDLDAAKKLQNDEYDWVMFPPTPSISMAFRRGYVPPLKQIWTKKYQKEHRGSDKLVGIVEGWYDEKNNKLYVLMMTTRKDYRRRGVNSYLITYLRQKFGLEKDQVIFDKPTDEGKLFEASGKYHLGGEMSKHLAPNGKPSNLTHEQWHLVRTPEFKAWFGDWENDPENASKVVDENGEPMVVYHFSDTDFNIFQLKGISNGFFFTQDIEDDEFSQKGWLKSQGLTNEQAIEKGWGLKYEIGKPYFLNIRHFFTKSNVKNSSWSTPYFENVVIEFAKRNKKNDGVEFLRELDNKRIIVAFDPTQIKLADGTNTTFDGSNPDIRYARGGGVTDKTDNMSKIQLPDTESTFENLQPILAKQGYDLRRVLRATKSVDEIATDFSVPKYYVERELMRGISVELEHTDREDVAREIALHHLAESPNYYINLAKMEAEQKPVLERGGYFKRGGEVNPDDSKIKNAITHKSGSAGGLLVGNRHSEGGIKAVNKSTGQPLEMEGGEVVITRNAVSDGKKREFEGEMLTNREILSRINESGGGVSFAKGGDVPHKCACSGKEYKFGGKVMKDNEIVRSIVDSYPKIFTLKMPISKPYSHRAKYGLGGTVDYLKSNIPTLKGFATAVEAINPLNVKNEYKQYLSREYSINFEELPNLLKSALFLGNQKIIDTYISRH